MTFQGSGLCQDKVLCLSNIENENPPNMKINLPFFIFLSCLIFSQKELQAQCPQVQFPTTECEIAPVVCPSSGLLNEYCGTNSNFNFNPNLQPPNFCGTLQNPDWIGFIPISTNVDLHFLVENCSATGQIPALQVMAFKGCSPNWEAASDCFHEIYTNTSETISMNNLEIGEVYYLLVDGFSGAICDYNIQVISGALAGYGDDLQANAGDDIFINCSTAVTIDAGNSVATANAIFTWVDEVGSVVGTGVTHTTTQPGTYTLIINDPDISICLSRDTVLVILGGVAMLELGDGNYLDCNSGEVTIQGENVPTSPDYTYSWITSDGNIISGADTPTPLVNMVGSYQLTIYDNINQCDNSDIIQMYEFDEVLTVDSLFQLVCSASGSFDLTATTLAFDSPDFIYSWTTTNGLIVSDEDKRIPKVNGEGTYNISFTDALSGCTFMDEVTVIEAVVPPIPIIDVNGYLTCNQGEVELSAQLSILNNPVTYRWIDPWGDVISTSETANAQHIGQYILELTDVITGCVFSTEEAVDGNLAIPSVSMIYYSYELNCANNFTVELEPSVSGGWSIIYLWTYEYAYFSSNANITVTEPGMYELVVTNSDNGCTSQISTQIIDNGFDVNLDLNTATCDMQDGTATVSSALINPLYEWSTGVQGSTVSGLGQGWYSVTVTDVNNNCSKYQNFYIDEDISCKVVISGYVVNDSNNTCTYDASMEGMEQVMVRLYPLGYYTMTDSTGYYEFVVDDGNYSVQYINNSILNLICPIPGYYNIDLNTNGASDDDNHFFVQRIETDLSLTKVSGNAVPGRDQFNLLEVCNNGLLTQNAVVTFFYDTLFSQVPNLPNIEPLNSNAENYIYDSNNNTFTWTLNNLNPGDCRKIAWMMETPLSAQIGESITSTAEVNPIAFDVNPNDNYLSWIGVVSASFDPNIKQNYVGETLSGGAIYEDDTTMDYLIHFQNVGTDTAFTVVVRDTLDDAHLDVTTLRGFISSHDMQVEFEGTNVLVFRFENIYLVDSLTNEEASKGWVGFQIDLLPNQIIGTEVLNQAAIFFDFNEPIITNEIVNTVDQHFYKIEGVVKTENGEGVKDVNVLLSGDLTATTLTDNLGDFSIEDLNPNESFELNFEKNTNPWNGVTTQDIVAIRKHILGLEYLDSPYKLLAADVNNSGGITGLDMVLIRSLILLNIMEFPNSSSWKIVDGNYVFPNPTQPWGSPIPASFTIGNIDADRLYNMIGIKMGDVNNSAQPWNLLNAETREKNEILMLSADNQIVRVGEEVVVGMRAKEFKEMVAYQFTLDFDAEKLNFTGFEKGVLEKMTEQNIGTRFLEKGKLTIAWTTVEGKNINDNEPLFFLKFKAKQNGNLSKMLQVSSSKTEAVAYDEGENVFDVNLVFEGKIDASIMQVFPNPTNENIFVNIKLEKEISIQLEIFNAFGQLEKTALSNTIQPKGFFQQKINVQGFSPGTYFLKMKMGEKIVVRKFIVM